MQIQENNNPTQIHQDTQQDGTYAPTGTTGTQEVQKVSETPTYSQGILDFQGIAIGVRTIVLPIICFLWALAIIVFAIKNNDPSLLAPSPLELTPGTEIQAPVTVK